MKNRAPNASSQFSRSQDQLTVRQWLWQDNHMPMQIGNTTFNLSYIEIDVH